MDVAGSKAFGRTSSGTQVFLPQCISLHALGQQVLSFRMPKCKLHYLLRMQITRSTKVQIWWDWVAKTINLSPYQASS